MRRVHNAVMNQVKQTLFLWGLGLAAEIPERKCAAHLLQADGRRQRLLLAVILLAAVVYAMPSAGTRAFGAATFPHARMASP